MWSIVPKYQFRTLLPEFMADNPKPLAVLTQFPIPKNVWLFGSPGCGKTHLAKCALNRYTHRGCTCNVVVGPSLRMMAEQFAEDREDDLYALAKLDCLLLDDLDKMVPTLRSIEFLWMLLDIRYRTGRRTLVTANADPAALSAQWLEARDANAAMVTAAMDRIRPCVQYQVTAVKSLRDSCAPAHAPVCVERIEPITQEQAIEARNIVRLVVGQ